MNREIEIHIWELPEKINNIDKLKEYMMVHDGSALMKISAEKLYKFFNQDYKIDNAEKFFNDIIESTDKEYDPKYIALTFSTDKYEEWVKELSDKFKNNKNNLIRLRMSMNELININDGIDSFIKDINKRYVIFRVFVSDNLKMVNELISSDVTNSEEIKKIINDSNELLELSSQLYINSGSMKEQLSSISDYVTSDVSDKKEFLLNKINSEYDRIVSIIDYYHHIHS